MRPHIALPLIAVIFFSASCAGGRTSGSSPGRSSLITAEQIQEIQSDTQSLLQVIERLRPNWLVGRAATMREQIEPVVYVDGIRFGDLESLRQIPVTDVLSVRRISAQDATLLHGTGHAGGIIAVSIGR